MEYLINIEQNEVRTPKISTIGKADWIARKKARSEAEKRQIEGIESQDIFKATIEAKLLRAGAKNWIAANPRIDGKTGEAHYDKWFDNFLRCGVEKFYVMCAICEEGHEASYQCGLKWCPRCNWRITMNRRTLLEKVTAGMNGVKHVVLTQKNFEHLTREKILQSRKCLLDLRRQNIFGKVSGGCASLEFTNEEKGWHMHWHLLVQSKFIPGDLLAIAWGKLVGQEFAIVKVKAVTEKSYLQEICKYVVDGSELAKWKPEQILEFVIALKGTRCFTTWGKFKQIAKFTRAMIRADRVGFNCEICGMTDVVVGNDRQHCKRIAVKKGY